MFFNHGGEGEGGLGNGKGEDSVCVRRGRDRSA